MGKYYYNGVLLPEIPADVLAEYPYVWIGFNISAGVYYLFGWKEMFWKSSTHNRIVCTGERIFYKYLQDNWEYVNTLPDGGGEYGLDGYSNLWSNHDIPNGSATATQIYFCGSEPVPYPDLVFEDYTIKRESLTAIADAIRSKTGKTDFLTLEQMVTELEAQKAILELPAIPVDSTINKYKYLTVIRYNNPVGEPDYYLHASINKPYKYDGEQVLNTTAYIKIPSGGRCNYRCSSGETEWSFNTELTAEHNSNQYNFTIIWSNCDIPDGSATATEIYFKASPLIV